MGLVDYATYFGSGATHMGVGRHPIFQLTVLNQPHDRDCEFFSNSGHFDILVSEEKYQNFGLP